MQTKLARRIFNINSFTLTVAKSGTGGSVVKATGINCGTDCGELRQWHIGNTHGDTSKRIVVCRIWSNRLERVRVPGHSRLYDDYFVQYGGYSHVC